MSIIQAILNEKQEPCPLCGVEIDFNPCEFPMDKAKIIKCPWCNRAMRVVKKLRLRPKAERGIYFIVSPVVKEGSGRRKI